MVFYERIVDEYIDFKNLYCDYVKYKNNGKKKVTWEEYRNNLSLHNNKNLLNRYLKNENLLKVVLIIFTLVIIFASQYLMKIVISAFIVIIVACVAIAMYQKVFLDKKYIEDDYEEYLKAFTKEIIDNHKGKEKWDVKEHISDLMDWCEKQVNKKPGWFINLGLPENLCWLFIASLSGYAVDLFLEFDERYINVVIALLFLALIIYFVRFAVGDQIMYIICYRQNKIQEFADDLHCVKILVENQSNRVEQK